MESVITSLDASTTRVTAWPGPSSRRRDFASGRARCGGPPENRFVLRVEAVAGLAAGLNGTLSLSMRSMITATLRASATLALLLPARRAIRMAQLLSPEQLLIGFVSMMWAAS